MASEAISRRRFLTVLAVGAGSAVLGGGASPAEEAWRGSALGAEARLLFAGAPAADRRAAVAAILDEIERLEAVFSLARADSDLARLNAAGRLDNPPADLVVLLRLCARLHRLTGGLFDPTVQPLWRRFVAWYAADPGRGQPLESFLDEARRRIGFARVALSEAAVALPEGAELTLNGVAQGYITDRVAELLRARGFRHVLVEAGEIRALGGRTPQAPWRVAVPGRDGPLALRDAALATSAGAATRLGPDGDHHILDPRSGRPARIWDGLSVRHPSAAVADALSTGLYCASAREIEAVLARVPGATAWAVNSAGASRFPRAPQLPDSGGPLEDARA